MSYNPNIPQGNQTIASTQQPILTNFSVANTAFAVDHTAFDVATNQGMHKQVTLQAVLAADPNQVSPIASLYTKVSPSTVTSDLYYQNGALASNVAQVTGGGITAAAWCQFNGQTGTLNASYNVTSIVRNSINNYTINFTRNFANTNYCVQLDPLGIPVNFITVVSKVVGSYRFAPSVSGGLESTDVNVVIFGVLA